ncbi:MAG: retron system putative HNH endonuclease [Bacteroidia bacterium]|nr:retron system putative HNH endonuclease [Bacteroidia bacterium]
MIKVSRRQKPLILANKETEWKKAYMDARDKYSTNPSKENKTKVQAAESKYNQKKIKSELRLMFLDKCAYCESSISHIDYGHIEHFRPKSKFPELCFEWENLLLACGICNSTAYKGDKFPEHDEGGPFVNPVSDNPDEFFNFEFDPQTGTANVTPKNIQAITTEKELGLNRPELVSVRSKTVRMMAFIALKAKEGDEDAATEFRKYCQPDYMYSAFAKTLAERFQL